MNTMIIALAASTDMTFGERSAYSLRMLVVGMLMVFSVLALLWAVLALSKKLFYDTRKNQSGQNAVKPQNVKAVDMPAAVKPVVPATSVVTATPTTPANDAALVAAITAAIAATLADEGYQGGFRVVSFRRADNSRSWNCR
jgi:hypothetical protein